MLIFVCNEFLSKLYNKNKILKNFLHDVVFLPYLDHKPESFIKESFSKDIFCSKVTTD